MQISAIGGGVVLLAGVLLDAFQTIILPRRPVGRLRITRLFFLLTWKPWVAATRRWLPRRQQDQSYSIYGPASLLVLFVLWAVLLVSSFGLIYYGLGLQLIDPMHPRGEWLQLRTAFYFSGSTLFTLGLGDVLPATHGARLLAVMEAACGLGFIALVIGYVPVLYTAFSSREVLVALLDARAGSPPTAAELLVRHHFEGGAQAMVALLGEWERWCATLLETHISYPLLCYYRSQHDNQSWLAALTAVLDTCALLITTIEAQSTRQAQLTFAVGRHVLVDLGHVFRLEQRESALRESGPARLRDDEFARLCETLAGAGFHLCGDSDVHRRLAEIRKLYEPQAQALAEYLQLELPCWVAPAPDPSRRPTLWNSVANLRSPVAIANHAPIHISPQSTATHLDESEAESQEPRLR